MRDREGLGPPNLVQCTRAIVRNTYPKLVTLGLKFVGLRGPGVLVRKGIIVNVFPQNP